MNCFFLFPQTPLFPIALGVSALVVGIGNLFKKTTTPTKVDVTDEPKVTPEEVYGSRDRVQDMQQTFLDVVNAHSDCTAEVANALVPQSKGTNSWKLKPGDKVDVRVNELGFTELYINDKVATMVFYKKDSHVAELLQKGVGVESYISGRCLEYYYQKIDLLQIISFYKVEGVPPTKVNVEL